MGKIALMIRNKTFPFVTLGIVLLNVAYFIILVLGGSPSRSSYMIEMGANYAPYVFKEHEYWRLITSMFMHFSFTHLAGNMTYLAIMGFQFEKIVGHVKFLLIYMLSGLGASVVSAAYHQMTGQPVVSAGASGAVYGIIAMILYITYVSTKRIRSPQMFFRIGIMLVFLFYNNFGMKRGVDNAAHIGGLVFGLLLCLLFLPVKKNKKDKRS